MSSEPKHAEPANACPTCSTYLNPNLCKNCGEPLYVWGVSWLHDSHDGSFCDIDDEMRVMSELDRMMDNE